MIKLLAVDDEAGIVDIIRRTFSPIGFTVLTATNGKDALAIIDAEHPRIVFLDIVMPGISGIDVLKKIKNAYKDVRVIMVTIMDDDETRQKVLELGADEFISKPFMPGQLEEVVQKMIPGILENNN